MLELMYVTPPTVQTGKLASARVGAIWADDAIWLDGVSRRWRMAREWADWTAWEDTNAVEKECLQFNLLHRWDTLYWRLSLGVSGAGNATVKVYYKGVEVMSQTAANGTHTYENSGYDISGISIGIWALALIQVKVRTDSGTTARVRVEWIEERPDAPSSYATPGTYADGATSSAAEMNKIASAITGLNSLARWPVQGFPRLDSGWLDPPSETSLWIWKHRHHGDKLYYRLWVAKDGSSLNRVVAWRLLYNGTEVATGSYSDTYNGDDDGQMASGSANISALAAQNDPVDIELRWSVTGSPGKAKGRIRLDYIATAYEGGIDIPGAIVPTAKVYGNTAGQTATLQKIANLLTQMADDSGAGYNSGGKARLFARSVAMPAGQARKRIYLCHSGWPTLYYRCKSASVYWGDNQSQSLEDWPTGGSVRVRSLSLEGLNGLAPGMVYYIESTEEMGIDYAAEVRS